MEPKFTSGTTEGPEFDEWWAEFGAATSIAQQPEMVAMAGWAAAKARSNTILTAERDLWELRARTVLWLHHGCSGMYGDDGEMQCARMENHPGVWDFKRTPWETIVTAFTMAMANQMPAMMCMKPTPLIVENSPGVPSTFRCKYQAGHDGPCDWRLVL